MGPQHGRFESWTSVCTIVRPTIVRPTLNSVPRPAPAVLPLLHRLFFALPHSHAQTENRCTAVSVGSSATHAKQLKNSASAESSEGFSMFPSSFAHTGILHLLQSYPKLFFFFFFFLSSSFFSFTSCPRRISQLPTASAFLLIVQIFFFACFHIFQHFETMHTSCQLH